MCQAVPVRADIAAFCHHGGRIDAARAHFGDGDWIDLSTGIAPFRYPVAAGAVRDALHTLPSPEAVAALEAAAAATFGICDAARVVAVPGSDIALRLVADLLPARTVAVAGPGYGGHLAMWGRPVERVPMRSLNTVSGLYDAVIFANPNNPDGRRIARAALVTAAGKLAARDGWLIVDEAFADTTPLESAAAERLRNVVVLRSFGKFYGLPGLRLGFVIAPPPLVAQLRARLGDWPISGAAVVLGTDAYRDTEWQRGQRARLTRAAARLDALIEASGLRLVGGTSLFRLIETPDAAALFARLAHAHILTRPFADDPQRLRIGVPGHIAHWRRLEAALSQGTP